MCYEKANCSDLYRQIDIKLKNIETEMYQRVPMVEVGAMRKLPYSSLIDGFHQSLKFSGSRCRGTGVGL